MSRTPRVGAVHEPGLAGDQRRPGLTRIVGRAQQHEGQLAVEDPVLVRHVIGDRPVGEALDPLAHAHAFLHGQFAGVEQGDRVA